MFVIPDVVKLLFSSAVFKNQCFFLGLNVIGLQFHFEPEEDNGVRIIAGTLIQVGNGQYPPERVKKILDACDRSVSGPTAPAHGLTLIGIEFFD